MVSAAVTKRLDAVALQAGLGLTAVYHAITPFGDRTVITIACVEGAIRLLAPASVYLVIRALTVINDVVKTAMGRPVPTNAAVVFFHLSDVTHLTANVTASRVLQDLTVMSHAPLGSGDLTVLSRACAIMGIVIQSLVTALVLEAGKGRFVTRPVLPVASLVLNVIMETNHAIKPQEIAFVLQVTEEVLAWKLAMQVTMATAVKNNAFV